MTDRELFFRHLGLPSLQPLGLEIDRAEGVFLYDTAGKRYFDMVAGITVSNTGHSHPDVIKAIQQQLEKHLHLNVYGEIIQSPQVRFAARLSELLHSSLDSVYFVNSGSEAIEGAMKLAKRVTGRTEVISFYHAYHGSTQGALSILGDESLKNAFRPLLPDTRLIRFGNMEDLKHITHRTACVFAETIQAEAGMILPEEGFLEALRSRCTDTGTLLVIDDVQMGLGRTGTMFSFEHYGIVPDILVLAKALGGGLPLGAFISSREIMKALTHDPELGHITTFGGHPLSCAAGLAALETVISEDLAGKAEEKGKMIEDALKEHPSVRKIRRKGLALGIELMNIDLKKKFAEACLENGIIIDWYLFHPATFRIAPPLTITDEEIVESAGLIKNALNSLLD